MYIPTTLSISTPPISCFMLQWLNPTKGKRARELVNEVHADPSPQSQKGRSRFTEFNGRYPAQRRPDMGKWLEGRYKVKKARIDGTEISLPGNCPKDIMKDTQKF